jgi:RNA polymerase sigma-70 factor, ECF subfamily
MSTMGESDSNQSRRDEVLAAATGGDPAARWRAVEACRDYLRLVARRGRRPERRGLAATSDLVQGTVIDGWRHFSRFRGRTPAQLRAWLRAILIHASLNGRRRADAYTFGSDRAAGSPAASSTTPSQAAQQKESNAALDEAIRGLGDRYRTIVRLRVWEQMSFTQIGEHLGISEDCARMTYGRALAKLRESMRPGHDPE